MEDQADLLEGAKAVLDRNQRGDYTVPAEGLYPHQWLWDSCFISIGLRHYDIERAQKEILSLLRGQWANGMLPHMIFAKGDRHRRDSDIWRSWLSPQSPDDVSTSGITQPPMLAEATRMVGSKLKLPERRSWYQTVYPALIAYHQWLYDERDPHREGLTLQVHPWETGLDNTPPWMYELHQHQLPLWVSLAEKKPFTYLVNFLRRDTRFVPPGERLSSFEAAALYSVQHRLRRKAYSFDRILSHSLFAIEDLSYNCILIRANHHLREIAETIGKKIPEDLIEDMHRTDNALEQLWDAYSGEYYSRNFITHKLIKIPSLATLMPLYSGKITKERAAQLVNLLHDHKMFGPKFPVPSVPVKSEWFHPHSYWQGPFWVNTNWLIIDGLKRYGYKDEASHITEQTLKAVAASTEYYEYYSPLDGSPAGAKNFSWTAALTVDLLKS